MMHRSALGAAALLAVLFAFSVARAEDLEQPSLSAGSSLSLGSAVGSSALRSGESSFGSGSGSLSRSESGSRSESAALSLSANPTGSSQLSESSEGSESGSRSEMSISSGPPPTGSSIQAPMSSNPPANWVSGSSGSGRSRFPVPHRPKSGRNRRPDHTANMVRRLLAPDPKDVKMAQFMNQLGERPEKAGNGKGAIVQFNRNAIHDIQLTSDNPAVEDAEANSIKQAATNYAKEHQEELIKIRNKDKIWANDLEKWRQRSALQDKRVAELLAKRAKAALALQQEEAKKDEQRKKKIDSEQHNKYETQLRQIEKEKQLQQAANKKQNDEIMELERAQEKAVKESRAKSLQEANEKQAAIRKREQDEKQRAHEAEQQNKRDIAEREQKERQREEQLKAAKAAEERDKIERKREEDNKAEQAEKKRKKEEEEAEKRRQEELRKEQEQKRIEEQKQKAEEAEKRRIAEQNAKAQEQRQKQEQQQKHEQEQRQKREAAEEQRRKNAEGKWCQCVDKVTTWQWGGRWELCDGGYLFAGMEISHAHDLSGIRRYKCCKPCREDGSSVLGVGGCYDANWWGSFDSAGWSHCQDGTYIQGFWHNHCNWIYCLEMARCCRIDGSRGRKACDAKQSWWGCLDRPNYCLLDDHKFANALWRNWCHHLYCIEMPHQCTFFSY